jgi:hypothetical protein
MTLRPELKRGFSRRSHCRLFFRTTSVDPSRVLSENRDQWVLKCGSNTDRGIQFLRNEVQFPEILSELSGQC